jgi:hypothetical protein
MRSAELIGWALGGIEREIVETRNRLSALTAQAAQLRNRVGGKGLRGQPAPAAESLETPAAEGTGRKRRRRKKSPEARKRNSEMMKKRWAERKKAAK